MKKFSLLISAMAVSSSHAFVVGGATKSSSSSTSLKMGLLDDIKLLFSEEGKANRAAYEEQQRKEMEEAQREILERRTNPEMMGQYEQDIIERRRKFAQEKKEANRKDSETNYI